jgi:hypothetical protein
MAALQRSPNADHYIGDRHTRGDHLRKIRHTQKYMQVNRRNIIPVVKDTITTFLCILIQNIF